MGDILVIARRRGSPDPEQTNAPEDPTAAETPPAGWARPKAPERQERLRALRDEAFERLRRCRHSRS
eukprot:5749664-Alexandrium_andersonii.AAC.1